MLYINQIRCTDYKVQLSANLQLKIIAICGFLAVVAEKFKVFVLVACGKAGLNRLVVGNAGRVHTLCNAHNLLRNANDLLLNNFEVFNYIDLSIRSNQGYLVYFLRFENSVCNLDNGFAAKFFALQIGSKGYLVFALFVKSQNLNYFKELIRRYMVQYGAVLNGAHLECFL